MKTVVVTGSTRGIGYGLADAFLARGCAVVVNGRSEAGVDKAVQSLAAKHGEAYLYGFPAAVSELTAVEALWQAAASRFKRVDIWVNNAGLGHDMQPPWEVPPSRVEAIVGANVQGVIFGSRVAMQGMTAQGGGALYNMEGFGSNGRTRSGLSIYGTSKAAVNYFTKSLIAEAKGSPVLVGSLSPGMVVTDLLMDPVDNSDGDGAGTLRVFNILADRVETVTPWLVDQMLANETHGAHINWLTTPKIVWRFLTAPFNRRDLFADRNATGK